MAKQAEKAKQTKAIKAVEPKVNPLDKGVTYEDFLKAIPKNSTVENYCKDMLEPNELQWVLSEIELFKNIKN